MPSSVTFWATPPEAGMTKTFVAGLEIPVLIYAILPPSGDHCGTVVSSGPCEVVSWTGLSPLACAVQISMGPLRLETKAMRLPSGEYVGQRSCREEEAITWGSLATTP